MNSVNCQLILLGFFFILSALAEHHVQTLLNITQTSVMFAVFVFTLQTNTLVMCRAAENISAALSLRLQAV